MGTLDHHNLINLHLYTIWSVMNLKANLTLLSIMSLKKMRANFLHLLVSLTATVISVFHQLWNEHEVSVGEEPAYHAVHC